MADLRDAGALGFTDDGKPVVSAGMLRKALQYQRLCGGVIALHEEDPALSGDGVMHEGAVSARLGLAGIPSVSESTMVARDAALARYEDARVHFQHLSCAESVQALEAARQGGARVTGEASPHHLTLTDDVVRTLDSRFKMNPPLRSETDRRALVQALGAGSSTASRPITRRTLATRRKSRSSRRRWARRPGDGVRRAVHGAGAGGRARARRGGGADVGRGALYDLPRRASRWGSRRSVSGRPRRAVRGRRARIRQPVGELLLPRANVAGPRRAHGRRRRDRLPGADARRGTASAGADECPRQAYVLLEEGPDRGLGCGADGHAVGEIVFTTSMSGYQEALSDPSYAGQLLTFTYPTSATTGSRARRWNPTVSTPAPRSSERR